MPAERSNHEFDDELLSAYVDNELNAVQRAAVEERLRTDERARQLVAELRAASEAVQALPRTASPRDFAASVLAEIESRQPQVDSAAVLAQRDAAGGRRGAGGRGLMWAGFAAAAALLLMILRPADERREAAQVAQSSTEKRVDADPAAETKDVIDSRNELSDLATGPAPRSAAPPMPAPAEGRAAAELERSQVAESAPQLPAPPGAVPASAPAPSVPAAAADAVAVPAAAPPAPSDGLAAAARPDDSSRFAREANEIGADAPAAGALVAPTSDPQMETVEVPVADEEGVMRFETLLSASGIAIVNEALPADLPADVSDRLAGTAVLEDAERDRASATGAYLVEASPTQIRALTDALEADIAKLSASAGVAGEETLQDAARARGAGGFGGGGGFGGRSRDQSAPGRAWRLSTLAKEAAEPASTRSSLDSAESMDRAGEAANEPSRRGGLGGSRGGGRRQGAEADEVQTARVLILLRRPEAAATAEPAAPAAAAPAQP